MAKRFTSPTTTMKVRFSSLIVAFHSFDFVLSKLMNVVRMFLNLRISSNPADENMRRLPRDVVAELRSSGVAD